MYREKPLALYVFANDEKTVDRFVAETSSGAVCANDTMIYFSGNVHFYTDLTIKLYRLTGGGHKKGRGGGGGGTEQLMQSYNVRPSSLYVCMAINNIFKAGFPLGEFVRANRERSYLIGWRQTLTTSPANHIHFSLVRANKFAKWKTGLVLRNTS